MLIKYYPLQLTTGEGVALHDVTPQVRSYLAAMLLGSSEVIPVSNGALVLGQYQSIMLVELNGSRERTLAVQVCGE